MMQFGHTFFSLLFVEPSIYKLVSAVFQVKKRKRGGKREKIWEFIFDSLPMTFGYFECSSISIYVVHGDFDPFPQEPTITTTRETT